MEQINRWRSYGFIFIMIAPVQYIIVGIIAMYFYSGGTLYNTSNPGFYLWGNYFSDLGRLVALSGRSNFISFMIFTPAALVFSISFIPFVILMPQFFNKNKKQYRIATFGSIAGIFAAIFLILTILTPWDIYGDIHLVFATLFNISGSFIAFFYFIVIMKDNNYPKIYGIGYLFLLILAIIYITLTFATVQLPAYEKIIIQATYQKFSQYSFLVCYFLQGYIGFKLYSK